MKLPKIGYFTKARIVTATSARKRMTIIAAKRYKMHLFLEIAPKQPRHPIRTINAP